MKFSMIVAHSENRVIGKDNDIPWKLKGDLLKFKEITMGHHLIMGRKTYESIGKVLKGRFFHVLTSQNLISDQDDLAFYNSMKNIETRLEAEDIFHAFIIGGGEIYSKFLPQVNTIYRTTVHTEIANGEVYFPELNLSEWSLIQKEKYFKDENNEYDYTFEVFERK